MPFRYLEDVAIADVAFEATSDTLEGLFEEAAKALTELMVNTQTLKGESETEFTVEAESVDLLLFNFLTKIIYFKDAEAILFKEIRVKISKKTQYTLFAKGLCDKIDYSTQELRLDAKAITFHMFEISKNDVWHCRVVVDV